MTKVKIVRERLSSREQETTGKWYTEEKLKSCGEYAPCLGRKTTMGDYVFTNNLVFKHIFVNKICVKMRLWLMNTQMYISFTCMFNFYVHTCMYQRNFCDFNQHMMCWVLVERKSPSDANLLLRTTCGTFAFRSKLHGYCNKCILES